MQPFLYKNAFVYLYTVLVQVSNLSNSEDGTCPKEALLTYLAVHKVLIQRWHLSE